jgi:methane/ammonia monooxygenase subunit A
MQKMADSETVQIYGVTWSKWAAALSRRFDFLVAVVVALAILSAFHLHFMLVAGDWDFWVDWKDRQWWPTLTPILAITFPAAVQYVFWEKFRLPIGATFSLLLLLVGEWLSRIIGFNMWSDFPYSLIWPATLLPGAIVLDTVLLLTGNFLLTAIFGGMAFGLIFYAGNWPMLAAYRLPMQVMDTMVSVGDYIGYAFTRTATPEYSRLIERGTLRTFGGHSAVIASFFAGFASTLMYIAWWYFGMLLARIVWVPNKLKSAMGFKRDRRQSAHVAAV